MPYLFATQDQDYSELSAGRVLYSQAGAPAFPVRLASEILQRARQIIGVHPPGGRRLALFDPTCGGAYHLAALGFLHGEWIETIAASDIDPGALSLARRNLGLLSPTGLEQREKEIERMLAQYGKLSHADALRSAAELRRRLEQMGRAIPTRTFLASAFDSAALLQGLGSAPVDLVLSDIPYGHLSDWQSVETSPVSAAPVQRMLGALLPVLRPESLVAIAADKHQKVAHPGYRRAGHFGLGKREITFVVPA
jgi:hypothetical protein